MHKDQCNVLFSLCPDNPRYHRLELQIAGGFAHPKGNLSRYGAGITKLKAFDQRKITKLSFTSTSSKFSISKFIGHLFVSSRFSFSSFYFLHILPCIQLDKFSFCADSSE